MMRRIKRVLQIANRAGPLHIFMLPLCRALVEAGVEVELACMPGQASWRPLLEDGYPVHTLPEGSWASPLTWYKVRRAVKVLLAAGSYDMVIAHTPAISWLVRPISAKHAGITVYFAHGLPFSPQQNRFRYGIYLTVEKYLARHTDGLLVMNRDDEQACKAFRLTRRDGLFGYIPGVGIDVNRWSEPLPESRRKQLREELQLSEGKPVVLFLGRFIRTKRPQDILRCAARMQEEADFILAGEGPLWRQMKRRARQLGPHVHVLEFVSNAAELMMLSDIVALPSVFREGLPHVLLEAAAAAKPIVAYDIRGVRDIVQDGYNGYLIRSRDVVRFSEALRLLVRDSALRQRLGQQGRRIVQANFTLEHSLAAIISFINTIAGAKGYSPIKTKLQV